MNTYLLDSNIIIYGLRETPEVLALLNKLKKSPAYISSVSYLEILLGRQKDGISEKKLMGFLNQFGCLPFDKKIAERACDLSHTLKKKLRFNDLTIAAMALERDLTLITADKDFRNIAGLKIKLLKV